MSGAHTGAYLAFEAEQPDLEASVHDGNNINKIIADSDVASGEGVAAGGERDQLVDQLTSRLVSEAPGDPLTGLQKADGSKAKKAANAATKSHKGQLKKVPNAEAERVAKVPKSIVEGQNAAPGTKVALPKVTHTSKYGKTMGKFADGKGEASHTTYDEGKSSTTGAKVSKKGVDVNRSGKTVVPNQGGGDTIHEGAGGLNLSPTGFAVSGSEIVTKRDNKGEELQKLENSGTVAWDGEAATIAGSRMEDGSGIDANVTSDGTYEGTNGSISVASNGNSLGVVKGPDGVGIKASRGQYSGQISAKLSGEDKKVSAEFASSRMAVNTSVAWADDEYAISAGGSINGIGMGASISHEDGTTSGFNESDDGTAGALTASSVSGDGFGVNGSAKAYGVGGA